MTDLVSLSDAQSELSASLPADTSALQAVITAASRAVRRFCGRDFTLETYDETYDSLGYSQLILRQYPVNSITRLAAQPTPILTVSNTDATTNQRALAALATTGDVDAGLVVTGLKLTRVASGISTTDTSVTFAANVTAGAVASAVTALGNGWQGTAATGYPLWASADLRAVQGVQNALAGSAGAVFYVHAFDVTDWSMNERTGIIRMNNPQFDPVFALMNMAGSVPLATFPSGFQSVRVQYSAGYATVPGDVVQAVLIAAQDWLYQLQKPRVFRSETIGKYSYSFADAAHGLPERAKKILTEGGWRAYRRY